MKTSLDHKRKEISDRLRRGESLRSIASSLGFRYQTLQYHRRIWGCRPLRGGYTHGEKHASWKGGMFVDRWGYKMVRSPERKTRNPYTPEHVIVAEKMIGRQLKHGEHVHHVNADKTDNRPENLLVCTAKRHRELHRQLEKLALELVQQNQIVFRNGSYQFA